MHREFCPNCGNRIQFSMGDIVGTAQDQAAQRRGTSLNQSLRTAIFFLITALAILQGIFYVCDKRLVFDGSELPSIQANATVAGASVANTIELKPFVEPHPLPTINSDAPRVLQHRKEPMRSILRTANRGASKDIDAAIERGLQFFTKTQDSDGGWPVAIMPTNSLQGETGEYKWGRLGVSSLVTLAFLGDGNCWVRSTREEKLYYADTVQKAVRYLVTVQDPETGRFGSTDKLFMYNHAMATLAVTEAAALSGDRELLERATKAVDYLVKTQTGDGGWEYFGKKDSDLADISISSWPLQALHAARDAGIKVPDDTFARALAFYRKSSKGERAIYRLNKDDGFYLPSRNGMVLMMRELCGDNTSLPDVAAMRTKLSYDFPKVKPGWGVGWNPRSKDASERAKFNPYELYFCTYAMFFGGGKEWLEWNTHMTRAMLDMQDGDGCWRANDVFSQQGGTWYSTAMSILTLQVHHRLLHAVATEHEGPAKPQAE